MMMMDNLVERAQLTDGEIAQAVEPHSLNYQRFRAISKAQLRKALEAVADTLYTIEREGRETWVAGRLSFLADELVAKGRGL